MKAYHMMAGLVLVSVVTIAAGFLWPGDESVEFVTEGLYADADSVEGMVEQAPIIVVARFLSETRRLSLDSDDPRARREDVSWTEFLERRFEVRQVLRGDLASGVVVATSWPARSSQLSDGVRSEFDFTPAALSPGEEYLVFLAASTDYRGQPLVVPGASPAIARIGSDGVLRVLLAHGYLNRMHGKYRQTLAAGEVPPGLRGVRFDAIPAMVAASDTARAQRAKTPSVGIEVPPGYVAFETLLTDLPSLATDADVLRRARELGLDGASLATDPGICRKIEAAVRDARGRDLGFGCR